MNKLTSDILATNLANIAGFAGSRKNAARMLQNLQAAGYL